VSDPNKSYPYSGETGGSGGSDPYSNDPYDGGGGDNGNQGGKGNTGGQVGNGGVGSSNNPADHQGPTATSSGGTAFNGNAGVAGYQNDRSTVSTTTKTFGHIPILLDLDGNGIKITELQRSQKFVDAEGEGFHNRTAWAGAGDAVLFFDDNNSNKIDEKKEFIFSEWDPSATSDMEALRSYFDSDGDGWLTSADAKFAQFKLEIANADGTRTHAIHDVTKYNNFTIGGWRGSSDASGRPRHRFLRPVSWQRRIARCHPGIVERRWMKDSHAA
jgi:trimeric autotransporter adhesin